MKLRALLTGALLSPALAASPSLSVWLPERGEAATLSPAGLVSPGGRVSLDKADYELPIESPMAGGFVRLTHGTARLDVVQGGKIIASRQEVYVVRLQGTERGPCLGYEAGNESVTRCYTPDLKTEWAKLPRTPFIEHTGRVAYTVLADWKREKPVSDSVEVIRRDIDSGEATTLTYRVPLPSETLVVPAGMVDPLERHATLRIDAELAGGRFLVCASTTIPKDPCRLDVVDRDFKRLFSLQGNAYTSAPQVSVDGKKLYFLGNTLQVWDTQTGKRLARTHDPLWDKRGDSPFRAYLTPDNTQAVIFTRAYNPKTGPDLNHALAYIYRLSDGKRLNSFALKP